MSARLQLLGMDGAALDKLVVDELGESRFRAKQIAQSARARRGDFGDDEPLREAARAAG